MYIDKCWGNFIGGSDDSLNLVAFLEDQKKEEIPLSEIFAKIGLDKQKWDFHQTVEYLEFTHSDGVEMDFHFAIDVVTDLAAILLECSVSGSVNLQDLDEYNTPARRIRITATPEEHGAMNKALADFAQNPLEYDLSEMMDDEEIQEMARDVEALRKELYEAAGRNRSYHVKAEDMKNLLPDWEEANGCIATNRITVEGCKVGYCYREEPDGDWDSGWRFTAGDESDEYMDDPNNAGLYGLNSICNDDSDIIPLLNTPAPCAFERDENGVFQQMKDWKPEQDEEDPDMDILEQCQKWHENDEYQKIVDALETIPAEERTPEMDSELARAYNNLADPHKPGGKDMLKKAIALLEPHEEYFAGDHFWNLRMGYSYFYLDQEGRALQYFEKALKARPDDEDTKSMINWCKKYIDQQEVEEQENELDETLTGMDYIPYTPQNEEEFFEQIEQWNDEDEYTRCIQALNAIPEDWQNYRTAYALARALENYAIIGDHDEGTPNYKGDKALLRAIEVLESVQEEGQDKAEWNMRMAYGYQYLYGQEEKAIPYAQRWAELDPEDENAPAVIQECQKEIVKRAEAADEDESDHTGVFTGFVLLSKAEWDKEQFIRDMKEKWDIAVDEYDASEEKDDDALVFEVGDMLAAVSLNNYPIPGGEAEGNAENNYMWEDAVKVAKEHRAHLMVAVLGKEEDLLEKGKLFTKMVAACCHQKYATGIYTSGVVFEPRFYEGFADMMLEDELPIFNWIWFGLWRDENGMNGYTYGLDSFGKDEMEVLGTDAEPGDLRDFLASLVSYVLENDVELHDGETIGFAEDDKHTITRSPGVGLPEDQMTLKISWASSDGDPDNNGEDGAPQDEESGVPEVYTEEEMEAVEGHIQQYFGKFENVFHELSSPDIHVDICVVPPTKERDYYTLVTMGMGAHRMNVPEELAEYKLERAELVIALPKDWKLKQEELKNERWYWPIHLLKTLARLPIASDTWLGFGHTMDNQEDFAKDTKLCAAILTGPQDTEDGSEVCVLPGGEEVNFYQVIPLYRDELEYKLAHDAEALLDKMDGISFVTYNTRPNAITMGTIGSAEDGGVMEMDDADWHLESIQEKELPVDEINAYNHLAIYLRWCMEHDLMGEEFLAEYGEVVEKVKTDPAGVDLREFLRDELDGQLVGPMFNKIGGAFASCYYGEPDSPYFPSDIDNYALEYFGAEKYHSDEFQDEAYLFIPFDEDYYQAMAQVIEERFTNWQGQDFDEDTLEPTELAKALMEYLDCECTYFPSMKDDDPIMAAYGYAKWDSAQEGFVPVLIKANDETLLECLVMNADPENDADFYEFDLKTVTEYRKKILSAPVKDGKAVLEELTGQRKEEAEDDDMDWDEEVLGEMEGGEPNDRFSSYWDDDTEMTYPLILAKIPVKNPWEIFAYLPFGNWNDCPNTPELMAAAKYWFEQYGAVPAAMSHDELEFLLPAPVPEEKAMNAAVELYGFCPDVIDQGPEDAAVGVLADVLRQSTVWYFWWD